MNSLSSVAPLVIVGSGLAGWTLAREIRKLDKVSAITLICADSGDFYSKPMLSNALAQKKTAQELVNTPAANMAAQLNVDLLANTRVTQIDRARKMLVTDQVGQGEFPYSQLVLALGADVIRLPLAGDAANEVMSVNDLNDYARFRATMEQVSQGKAPGATRVAIIGAGLIGCEFANDLAHAGFEAHVIDPTTYPLSSLLPETAGRALMAPLAEAGVNWHFGRSVQAVNKVTHAQGERFELTLDNGDILAANIVLSAVGLRPRTVLAKEAGLIVNRGIVADKYLRTSDADIYALGDCAEINGQVLPYVLPIMHAARALAQNLAQCLVQTEASAGAQPKAQPEAPAGEPIAVAFTAMPVIVKTPSHPVTVSPVARDAIGVWEHFADDLGVKSVFVDANGRTTGFALTGTKVSERAALVKLLG